MICRTTGKVIIYRAPTKKHSDLVPIILSHAQPNSTLISDQAAMYVNSHSNTSKLERYGFRHVWVNHSVEYVSSQDPNIHTNNIERVWRSLKGYISHIKRTVKPEILDGYIDCFMLKYNVGEEIFADVVMSIFAHCNNISLE